MPTNNKNIKKNDNDNYKIIKPNNTENTSVQKNKSKNNTQKTYNKKNISRNTTIIQKLENKAYIIDKKNRQTKIPNSVLTTNSTKNNNYKKNIPNSVLTTNSKKKNNNNKKNIPNSVLTTSGRSFRREGIENNSKHHHGPNSALDRKEIEEMSCEEKLEDCIQNKQDLYEFLEGLKEEHDLEKIELLSRITEQNNLIERLNKLIEDYKKGLDNGEG